MGTGVHCDQAPSGCDKWEKDGQDPWAADAGGQVLGPAGDFRGQLRQSLSSSGAGGRPGLAQPSSPQGLAHAGPGSPLSIAHGATSHTQEVSANGEPLSPLWVGGGGRRPTE